MKILAVDYGKKRMGFAVGDTAVQTAVPIKQLRRTNLNDDVRYIEGLTEEYEIQKIIIGYPLNMDGTGSEMTAAVDDFCRRLKKSLKIAVETIDERLTSFEAEEMLKPLHRDYTKRKGMVDSVAASVILKDYMENL